MCDQRGEMIFCSECQTETDHYNGHCGECFTENKAKAPEDPNTKKTVCGDDCFCPDCILDVNESKEEDPRERMVEAILESCDGLHSIGLMDDETRELIRELATQPEESKFLRCPFCGERPQVKIEYDRKPAGDHRLIHKCPIIGYVRSGWVTYESLLEWWNTRHK